LPALASSTGVGLWRLSSSVCHIEVISLTYKSKNNMNHKKEKEEEEEREIVLHLIIIPTLYGCVALKHNC
jgi:hypothetical protein